MSFRTLTYASMAVLFFGGLALLSLYRYQLNPDGISYISVARLYLRGNFAMAINGYWSPLLSWLLVPFLIFGVDALVGVKIISLLSAILGLFASFSILEEIPARTVLKKGMVIVLIPLFWYFTFIVISPDLLSLSLVLCYCAIVFKREYPRSLQDPLLCGCIAGLAYVAKSYVLPFFLVHFTIMSVIKWYSASSLWSRRFIIKSYLIGLGVSFLIAGPWIALISLKYHTATIGTAARYNLLLQSPANKIFGPKRLNHPTHYQGLLAPPYPDAVSVWDDPGFLVLPDWQPFRSWHEFWYLFTLVKDNIYATVHLLQMFPLLLMFILAAVPLCAFFVYRRRYGDTLTFITLTMTIFWIGYLMILVEERYLWLLLVLAGIVSVYFFDFCLTVFVNKKFRVNVVLFLTCMLLVSFWAKPVGKLVRNVHIGREVVLLSKQLHQLGVQGKLASNGEWQTSLYISYFLGSRYYGEIRSSETEAELTADLRSHNIAYYLFWNTPQARSSLLPEHGRLTAQVGSLAVYKLEY